MGAGGQKASSQGQRCQEHEEWSPRGHSPVAEGVLGAEGCPSLCPPPPSLLTALASQGLLHLRALGLQLPHSSLNLM